MSEKWQNVGRIKGEDGKDGKDGKDGAKGDKGDKGEQGIPGNPLIIKGSFNDESELPQTGELGNAYIVDGDLYVWGDF